MAQDEPLSRAEVVCERFLARFGSVCDAENGSFLDENARSPTKCEGVRLVTAGRKKLCFFQAIDLLIEKLRRSDQP
jgi:hypothetical protein